MRERILPAPDLPLDTVVIVGNGVVAVVGRLSQLIIQDGDDAEDVVMHMHPDEIENFIATWFPGQWKKRRLH